MVDKILTPWPAHPQPLPDEVFSSWMVRCARANGQKLSGILSLMTLSNNSFNKRIDSYVAPEKLAVVAQRLRTSIDTVFETTLESYRNIVFEHKGDPHNPKRAYQRPPNILCPGLVGEKGLFYQQYCPKCLSEGEPYYRKKWRLSFLTVCSKHGCRLHDRCHVCGEPAMVMLNNTHKENKVYTGSFTACHNCLTDLKNSPIVPISKAMQSDAQFLEGVCKEGYWKVPHQEWVYSFSLLIVVRHMIRVFVEQNSDHRITGKIGDPDFLPLSLRFKAMEAMTGLFSKWPENFISYCLKNDIKYSAITPMEKNNFGRVPLWLGEVLKPHLYKPNINPTTESVLAAIQIMKNRGLRISALSVNSFMGFKDSAVINRITKKYRMNL